MIPTLIIDDEENNRNVLSTLLKKYCPEISIIDEAGNADEAFLKINKYHPKLIFLDIKMPQKSGFDLLKMFPVINFEVVFVTAFDHYAIHAFEFNAVAYILKPINYTKLIKAVEKVSKWVKANENNNLMLHFVKTLSDTNELMGKFSVHHNGKVVFINVSDISFIETKDNNTTLNLHDGSHYYSSKDLIAFETILRESQNFIRINKNIIINSNSIKSYSKGETCMIDMKTGQTFEVSRRRKSEILKKLKTP